MTETTNVHSFRQPSAADDPLADILRAGLHGIHRIRQDGARRMRTENKIRKYSIEDSPGWKHLNSR
jgi:hypothetical protein